MTAYIIDGKKVAQNIQCIIAKRVELRLAQGLPRPGLGVVLVGDSPASQAYVRSKERVAKQCGFFTRQINLPAHATTAELDAVLINLNNDSDINGILLQLPLPVHLNVDHHLSTIDPEKDVDGLHVVNQGKMAKGMTGVRPCTPYGIMRLLDEVLTESRDNEDEIEPQATLKGLHAVVIGRSILVGKPIALMMLEAHATVTIAHSRTPNLLKVVQGADIVVAACGRPLMVKSPWIKEGAIVIDVGINRLDDGTLVGDVDFAEAQKVAGAITPVPGGVGPMTVAMLMFNTLLIAK
jgi:methylenetetrahydrofolate dehydrogenase (NADP+) / methenyltetrahydrofolate cyclohydrolase